jgi:hypothetical protein
MQSVKLSLGCAQVQGQGARPWKGGICHATPYSLVLGAGGLSAAAQGPLASGVGPRGSLAVATLLATTAALDPHERGWGGPTEQAAPSLLLQLPGQDWGRCLRDIALLALGSEHNVSAWSLGPVATRTQTGWHWGLPGPGPGLSHPDCF